MEVQDVESSARVAHLVEHQHVIRDGIVDARVEPQRAGHATGTQLRAGDRIAAGEQGHVVALAHQLFGQVGDDTFGSAIESRRHAFHQRRNLRDFHIHDSRGVLFTLRPRPKQVCIKLLTRSRAPRRAGKLVHRSHDRRRLQRGKNIF